MTFKKNRTYDILKAISLIAVPVSTFIVAIMGAYGYANTERATAVLAAVNTLLGSLVKIAGSNYQKELEDSSSKDERLIN